MGPPVAILLRLIIPLSILRWPLAGVIASMIVDTLDVVIVYFLGTGIIPFLDNWYLHSYHQLDKYLDTYYLTFVLIMSLRWQNAVARRTSVTLYIIRAIGVAAFEITGSRLILFFAPNIFEYFFIAYTVLLRTRPSWELTRTRLTVLLLLVLLLKLPQEYLLHVKTVQPGRLLQQWYESRN